MNDLDINYILIKKINKSKRLKKKREKVMREQWNAFLLFNINAPFSCDTKGFGGPSMNFIRHRPFVMFSWQLVLAFHSAFI